MARDRTFYEKAAALSSLGVSFAVASAGGFVIGMWLDRKLGWSPVLTLTLGLLGIAAAFIQLVRTVERVNKIGRDPGR